MSIEYIYQKIYCDSNIDKNLYFIFGSNTFKFIKDVITQIYQLKEQSNYLKISCYSISKFKNSYTHYILGSLKDVKIISDKDIDCCIENCKNETRILDTNEAGAFYISVYIDETNVSSFLIIKRREMINQKEINEIIECINKIDYDSKRKLNISFIGIIENNDNNENDNEKIIESLFNLEGEFSPKETKDDINSNNNIEGIKEMDVSTLSVSLSQFKMSQYKDNHKLQNNKENTELIDCKNELILIKQEKMQLEQLVKLLESSLKLERKEKLAIINENAVLKQKLDKLSKKK